MITKKFTDILKEQKQQRASKFEWQPDELVITHHVKEDHEDTFDSKKFQAQMDEYGAKEKQAYAAYHDHKPSEADHEHAAKVHRKIGKEGRESIEIYKGGGYADINNHLRGSEHVGPHSDKAKEHIHHIDKATSQPLHSDHHTWRGFHEDMHHVLKKLKPGDHLHDAGYTSTSHKRKTADSFSHADYSSPDRTEHYYIARIHLKKGDKAHFLDHAAAKHGLKHEQEVLVHRGTTYKVDKIDHHDLGYDPYYRVNVKHHVIHMSVHHQQDD